MNEVLDDSYHHKNKNISQYDSQHLVSQITKDLVSFILELQPQNPLSFMADCLNLLNDKANDGELNSSNFKSLVKEVAEEMNDLSTDLDFNPPLVQRMSEKLHPLQTQVRKRIRSDFETNPGLTNRTNGLQIDSGVGLTNKPPVPSSEELMASYRRASISNQPINYHRNRRGSVSAESIQPSETPLPITVIQKSDEARMRIASATSSNLLFRNLDPEQKKEIVDAMFEKKILAKEKVINQGDEGDNFYVVDEGKFDIYVNDRKVIEVGAGGSFGELALMYNTPRAATVIAVEDSSLWAVDRVTFRRIITSNTFRKRRLYENFLRTIPLLKSLDSGEIVRISDALEPITFEKDDIIIEQGSMGDYFYMVESGEVQVIQTDDEGKEFELPCLKDGAYFGELALLNDAPRKASVIASTDVKLVALSKDAFVRLLGPVKDILQRNEQHYETVIGKPLNTL